MAPKATVAEEAEQPFIVGDGDLWVRDPDYLDPENQAQGALAAMNSVERGQWVLLGSGGDGTDRPYTQTWQRIGPEKGKETPNLRPIK